MAGVAGRQLFAVSAESSSNDEMPSAVSATARHCSSRGRAAARCDEQHDQRHARPCFHVPSPSDTVRARPLLV